MEPKYIVSTHRIILPLLISICIHRISAMNYMATMNLLHQWAQTLSDQD